MRWFNREGDKLVPIEVPSPTGTSSADAEPIHASHIVDNAFAATKPIDLKALFIKYVYEVGYREGDAFATTLHFRNKAFTEEEKEYLDREIFPEILRSNVNDRNRP